jgi:hypothetical protein
MIRIGKTRYKVLLVNKIDVKSPHTVGRIYYGTKQIQIAQKGHTGRPRSEKQRSATLWHECVHAILEDMGSRREKDEAFVDALAKRIQQVGAQIGF